MDWVDVGGITPGDRAAQVDGEVYSRSVSQPLTESSNPRWIEYDLSRDFKRLCGVAGVRDDSDADTAFEMEVFVDGVSKFTANVALGQPAPLRRRR